MNTKLLAGVTIAAALSLPLAARAQNGARRPFTLFGGDPSCPHFLPI
jgi:hypothetical protein